MNLDGDVYVVDLETTGTLERTKPTRIISIGIVNLQDNNKIYYSLVNPEEDVSPFIEKYTGITNPLLKQEGKLFKDISEQVLGFVDGCKSIIAAWPISFELPILQWEFANAGYERFPLNRRGLDIGTLAQVFLAKYNIPIKSCPTAKDTKPSLDNVLFSLGLPEVKLRHSALDDAMSEAEVLRYLLDHI